LLGTTPGGFYDAGVVSLVANTFGTSVSGFDFRCEDNNGSVQFFDQKTRAIQVERVQHLP
jgi:hypothetical protein